MAGLADFRAKNPQYNDVSDQDLADALYKKYYSSMPRADFDAKMGTTVQEQSAMSNMLQNRYIIPQERNKTNEFMVGLSRPVVNIDKWTARGLKKIGIDTGGEERYSKWAKRVNEMKSTGQVAEGSVPEMVGGMISTLPLAAVTKRPLPVNAMAAALTSDADTIKGVGSDALWGGVAGKATDMGLRGVGAAVKPKVNEMAQYLLDRGAKLTPGQILGGRTHQMEDGATSLMLPFIPEAQRRSFESYNHVIADEILGNIGSKLPRKTGTKDVALAPGHDTNDYVQQAYQDAYNNLLPKLVLKADPQFMTNAANLKLMAQNLPDTQRKDFDRFLSKEVMNAFSLNGTMSGKSMKEVEELMSKEIKNSTGNGASPHDRKYADAIRQLQTEVRELAERGNPTYAPELQKINRGYAMLTILENASANTKDGIATPAQFRAAVVQADPSVRHRMAASGRALFQDMARAGEQVLPRTVPDSGTPTRMFMNMGLGALVTGGVPASVAAGINPMGAAAIGAGLLPYTKTGGRFTRTLLARRPKGAATVRSGLEKSAPIAARAVSVSEIDRRNNDLPEDR